MSTEHLTKKILDAPYQDFMASLLPLYSSPRVKVRIPSASREYELSKVILWKQSPYFAATFEGEFREGQDQSTTLTEIDGGGDW
ncbi:hypothetical protein G7Y89_g2031 [Cudoniella acicularis]|uniref:BTB domain-containing protein n=1 Tax=Cudoniella acicularis TaxID=354080 RepID=A0A8H4W6G3_9HELO|nr:hypothetical protein G7Y89_g2031 [Cudoniella acicularis]